MNPPRWIVGPEQCISCDRKAELESHYLDALEVPPVVRAKYKCTVCGYISGVVFADGYVTAYKNYLLEKAKEEEKNSATTDTVS